MPYMSDEEFDPAEFAEDFDHNAFDELDDGKKAAVMDAMHETIDDMKEIPMDILRASPEHAAEYAEEQGWDQAEFIYQKTHLQRTMARVEPMVYKDRKRMYETIQNDCRWLLENTDHDRIPVYDTFLSATLDKYKEKLEKAVLRY